MKRSKMVETLKELFEDIPDGASSYHICDMLLFKAVRLGMMPPLNYNSYYNDGDNADIDSVLYYTWELENETND